MSLLKYYYTFEYQKTIYKLNLKEIIYFLCLSETKPPWYVVLADLEVTMKAGLASDSCLCLRSTGVKGVSHHTCQQTEFIKSELKRTTQPYLS